jgi:hypothetical protein
MAKNVVAYFYHQEPDLVSRAPEVLDMMSTRSWEVIITNMRKASSLTLGILKPLYPRDDLDVAGEGFAASCTEKRIRRPCLELPRDCNSGHSDDPSRHVLCFSIDLAASGSFVIYCQIMKHYVFAQMILTVD